MNYLRIFKSINTNMEQSNKVTESSDNTKFNSVFEYYMKLANPSSVKVESVVQEKAESNDDVFIYDDSVEEKLVEKAPVDEDVEIINEDVPLHIQQPRKFEKRVYQKRSPTTDAINPQSRKIEKPIVEKINPPQTQNRQSVPITPEESAETHTHLHKEDAELVSRLLRAKNIADASGIDISIVLQEMAIKPTTTPVNNKRQIDFKKDAKGNIIGAEIIN
jgi:hypothetical protein